MSHSVGICKGDRALAVKSEGDLVLVAFGSAPAGQRQPVLVRAVIVCHLCGKLEGVVHYGELMNARTKKQMCGNN